MDEVTTEEHLFLLLSKCLMNIIKLMQNHEEGALICLQHKPEHLSNASVTQCWWKEKNYKTTSHSKMVTLKVDLVILN